MRRRKCGSPGSDLWKGRRYAPDAAGGGVLALLPSGDATATALCRVQAPVHAFCCAPAVHAAAVP